MEMVNSLLEIVFDGEHDALASVKELYAKPVAPAEDDQEHDQELLDLLEEMGLTDTMNATEWHEDRRKIVRAKTRKLNKQRDAKRKLKAAAKEKKKRWSKAFAKKGKGKAKGAGRGKRALPAPGAAGTDGAPPAPGATDAPPAPGAAGTDGAPVAPGAVGSQPPPGVAGTDGDAGAAGGAVAVNAARPTEGGGWLVVSTEGGWIRFHPVQQKIDSHCSQHSGKCKMDRRMNRGTIGLACAWLAKPCNLRSDHIMEKANISSFEGKAARVAARAAFEARGSDTSDPEQEKITLLIDTELTARNAAGGSVEPDVVPCPDIARELGRALEAGQ